MKPALIALSLLTLAALVAGGAAFVATGGLNVTTTDIVIVQNATIDGLTVSYTGDTDGGFLPGTWIQCEGRRGGDD